MRANIGKYIFIAALFVLPVAVVTKFVLTKQRRAGDQKQEALLRVYIWPAEMQATAARVKARQAQDETHNAMLVNLKSFVDAKLTEAPMCAMGNDENNLADLPAGTNVYAGVPFNVQGSVQLMGGWLKTYGKTYPSRVENLPIHRECSKIHLLHGAGAIKPESFGAVVAKLVVHYEDGAIQEINITAGHEVFDWWSPTFETGIPVSWRMPAPDTELAWVGSNNYLRERTPDLSLCVYRTSFENSRPKAAISTLDYVSTGTVACPFLLGLTVE